MEQIISFKLVFNCPDCDRENKEELSLVLSKKTKLFRSFWCKHCGAINKIEYSLGDLVKINNWESGKEKKKPVSSATEF